MQFMKGYGGVMSMNTDFIRLKSYKAIMIKPVMYYNKAGEQLFIEVDECVVVVLDIGVIKYNGSVVDVEPEDYRLFN